MAEVPERKLSERHYLESELHSDINHQYTDGEIYAMSRAKANHSQTSANVYRKFGNHLEGNPCRPFTLDMKKSLDS